MKEYQRKIRPEKESATPKPKKAKLRKRFGVEYGRQVGKNTPKWWYSKWYETEKERDKAIEGLMKKGPHFYNVKLNYHNVYRKVERD
jgi:hypothetical protein